MNKISSFFQRSREEGPSPGALGRLHIDCVLGTTVVGWGCTAILAPLSDIDLQIAQQGASAEFTACQRLDVNASLGVSTAVELGFRLRLPIQLWGDSGELMSAELSLLAEGHRLAITAPQSVSQLLQELHDLEQHAEWHQAVTSLLQQLAQVPPPAWLKGETLANIKRLAQRIGWPQWPSAPARPCQGHLELTDGLVWQGWVFGATGEDETLRLYVNSHVIDASSIRTDRADVAAAMKTPRRQLGFEIELPGSIWQFADQEGRIRLAIWAGALNLCPQPIVWTVADLNRHLVALHEQLSAPPPDAAALTLKADHQYAVLVGLEHLIAAGDLATVPAATQQWFIAQAERFGLSAQATRLAHQRPQVIDGPQHDLSTIELWGLLRQFNSLVAEDGHDAADVLAQLCGERHWGEDTQHRFVCALVPYFCGLGHYEALRPWVSVGHLKAQAADASAWSLTLLLPELVWTEHYALARRVMSRLALTPKGWLNTECISAAVKRALTYWPSEHRQQVHAAGLVRATLDLLTAQAATYWGRSHDQHLTNTAVTLVVFARRLPDDLALIALRSILQQQAFNPTFWRLLGQQWPDTASWPHELQLAHSRFQDFEAAVWAGDFSPNKWVTWLSGSAAQGNFDAALALREVVLHAAASPEQFPDAQQQLPSMMSGLSPREALRLAAHPQAQPSWLRQPRALAQLIKCDTWTHAASLHEWRARLLRSLWAGQPVEAIAQAADLKILSATDHAGLGVILSVLSLAVPRSSARAEHPIPGLSDIRARWINLFNNTVAKPVPPEALLHAWSLLARWQVMRPDSKELQRLISECQQLACTRYGAELTASVAGPSAECSVMRSPDLLRTALVAIYSCRKHLDSRVGQIRASWGKRLDALGIPWLIVVGEGQGQLEDHLLQLPVPDSYEALPLKTLALIRWVHTHTDFTHLIKIDDDCHFAVDRFFEQSPYLAHHYLGRKLSRTVGGTDRTWHQSKSSSPLAHQAIDKSPEPSEYADGGSGYCLSRFAMGALLNSLNSTAGARLTRSAYMEDKLVGDLLSLSGIKVCEDGYDTLVRRRFGSDPVCVSAYSNTFYPSLASPTLVTHLDDASAHVEVEEGLSKVSLSPAKIWPSDRAPQVAGEATNQLELLSPPSALSTLARAPVIVVAVLRNEMLLLPHFLEHYRKLGASQFVLVDNLSDDGSRAYLLSQPDVVLYSADTEYRKSHFGVAWQQAVLAAHALGKWVILADIDEFLVYETCEARSLSQWVEALNHEGVNAVSTLMIDMYPRGGLAEADFRQSAPFDGAPYFDRSPLIPWKLGSGCFSNGATWLSGLRHRLIEESAPNFYTSQKIAVLKYQPWIRLSEGLHYASNVVLSSQTAYFAHFKYHAGFGTKVRDEVARKQHFNDAEEYQRYVSLIAEGGGDLWREDSLKFTHASDYGRAISSKAPSRH